MKTYIAEVSFALANEQWPNQITHILVRADSSNVGWKSRINDYVVDYLSKKYTGVSISSTRIFPIEAVLEETAGYVVL